MTVLKALESERSSVKELEEDLKIAVEQGVRRSICCVRGCLLTTLEKMKYRDALQKLLQVHERCGRVAGRSEGEQDRVVALEAQLQDKDKV